MSYLNYEFEIFDDLLTGCLNPSALNETRTHELVETLKENNSKCLNMVVGEFDTSASRSVLKKKWEISNHHPLAEKYFVINELPFETKSITQVPKYILDELDIDNQIIHSIYTENKGRSKLIGISHEIDFKNIDLHRLKYCFYNCILSKQVEEIKRNLKFKLFPLEDDKVCQYVKKTQFILLNFAMEVSHKFDLTPGKVKPTIKEFYNNSDCMALVYLYIVDLINYLEQNFKQYIDADLQIPFHSDLLKKYNFPEKAKNIEKQLKKLDLDRNLFKMIQKPLNKILNLCFENRITYHEVNYFKIFLAHLEKGLAEKDINQDSVEKLLVEVDYNEFEVSEAIINQLNDELSEQLTIADKELYLVQKRKTVAQIIIRANESFNKRNEPLKENIINWIEGELYYLKTLAVYDKEIDSIVKNIEDDKLQLNLSVPQLALFLKLINDLQLTEGYTLTELTRWTAKHICTTSRTELSHKNLYNRTYEISTSTIDEVKSKIIEMVNYLNTL